MRAHLLPPAPPSVPVSLTNCSCAGRRNCARKWRRFALRRLPPIESALRKSLRLFDNDMATAASALTILARARQGWKGEQPEIAHGLLRRLCEKLRAEFDVVQHHDHPLA